MDLIILLGLIVVVVVVYRDIKFVVYLLGILEIFFRLVHYLGDNIPVVRINPFVDIYIPKSIFSIINKYTVGIVGDIMSWTLVLCFIVFLIYLVKYFIKKK